MAKKFQLKPGHELRGLMIRLYPDTDTEEKLLILESDLRKAWNWLVSQTEQVIKARQAYAVKNNLVPKKPTPPDYTGLQPEESKAAKEKYYKAAREWHNKVHQATNNLPGLEYRSFKELLEHYGCSWDYQLLQRVIDWTYDEEAQRVIKPGSCMLQALTKDYFSKSKRRKKFRKDTDSMPLRVKSGQCFEIGNFGKRRNKDHWYNCQVKINGLKIRGRLPGKLPEGRVIEGVSLTKKADGWWASIKVEQKIPELPEAVPNTVVGIDVGLDDLAAISEVRVITNPGAPTYEQMGEVLNPPKRIKNKRNKDYSDQIAGRQAQGKPVGRLQSKAARHIRHLIHNEIVKPLRQVETIKIEQLSGRIGQMGSSKQSAMRLVASILKDKLRDRVREVQCHHTSQDCSQCGFRSKESWSYENGKTGECPKCKYRNNRDVNAARNIAAKLPISLEA